MLFTNGAFSCIFCHRTFNLLDKISNLKPEEAQKAHFNMHVGRFFQAMMSSDDMKAAFYTFCKNEAEYIKLLNC